MTYKIEDHNHGQRTGGPFSLAGVFSAAAVVAGAKYGIDFGLNGQEASVTDSALAGVAAGWGAVVYNIYDRVRHEFKGPANRL
jgi:hypothetical protein